MQTITVSWANSAKSFTSLDAAHTFRRWIESAYPALRGSVVVRGQSPTWNVVADGQLEGTFTVERFAIAYAAELELQLGAKDVRVTRS